MGKENFEPVSDNSAEEVAKVPDSSQGEGTRSELSIKNRFSSENSSGDLSSQLDPRRQNDEVNRGGRRIKPTPNLDQYDKMVEPRPIKRNNR